MKWTKERLPVGFIELYSIRGEDGRYLGGDDAAYFRGEADWLLSLINASPIPAPPEEET